MFLVWDKREEFQRNEVMWGVEKEAHRHLKIHKIKAPSP